MTFLQSWAVIQTILSLSTTTHNGGSNDAFISRLDVGVALYGDVHEIAITTGGMPDP